MKNIVAFFGALLICGITTAQEKIDFYKFIEGIEWNSTRELFVEKYRDMIVPDSVEDKSKIRLTDIYIGPVASNEATVSFDTITTKLKGVMIYYRSDFEYDSEYAKRWTAQLNQNLQNNIGEPYDTAFHSYYFHPNSTIRDTFSDEGARSKYIFITPPSPRYEKDFRVANWGDSKEKIRSLEGRINKYSDRDLYAFEDRLGELDCTVVYKFVNDKLIWAKYMFEDIEDDMAIYHYNRFEKMLDKKYGVVQYDGTHWKSSKHKDEYKDKEIDAIKKGYKKKHKFWCNGPTKVFLGIITSNEDKKGWYLTIEYHGREMEKVQEKAVFDAL